MKRLTTKNGNGKPIVKDWPNYMEFDIINRIAAIEDILGEEYELDGLREMVEADRMIGQEVWSQERYLKIFREKSSFIQRTTIQYVSLLKGGDILCHTQTCAFALD